MVRIKSGSYGHRAIWPINQLITRKKKKTQAPKPGVKKSGKARYKGGITSNPPKNRKKKYDALDTFKVKQRGEDGKVRLKPIPREDGIHSRQWALSIFPQSNSPLLSLPLELRQKIYTYAFHCPYNGDPKFPTFLIPQKKGNCYIDDANPQEFSAVTIYNTLSILSKQTYLDVVGSSLFYQVVTLSFNSLYLLEKFLSNINPIHYNSIQNLNLYLSSTRNRPSFPSSVFSTITSLANLKYLELHILVDRDLCYYKGNGHDGYSVKMEILRKWAGVKWELVTGMESLERFELLVSPVEVYNGFRSPMIRGTLELVEGLNEIRTFVGARMSDMWDNMLVYEAMCS